MKIIQELPFTQVPNHVIDDEELTAMDMVVYTAICRYANKAKECYPSLSTVAKVARCSKKTVVLSLRVLALKGYVVKSHRKSESKFFSNEYFVPWVVTQGDRGLLPRVTGVVTQGDRGSYPGCHKQDVLEQDIKNKKPAKRIAYTEEHKRVAEYLKSKILEQNSEAKFSDTQVDKWACEVRKMVEIDKRAITAISSMIDSIFMDSFWSGVIRSAGSLREKWNDGKLDRLKNPPNPPAWKSDEEDEAPARSPYPNDTVLICKIQKLINDKDFDYFPQDREIHVWRGAYDVARGLNKDKQRTLIMDYFKAEKVKKYETEGY